MNHPANPTPNRQLDLRDWIASAKDLGELVELEGVHWDMEMGALTQIVHERSASPPALLFSKIPGYPDNFRTLYGSLSSVKRLALTLGMAPSTITNSPCSRPSAPRWKKSNRSLLAPRQPARYLRIFSTALASTFSNFPCPSTMKWIRRVSSGPLAR
jgi:hypothetical protein